MILDNSHTGSSGTMTANVPAPGLPIGVSTTVIDLWPQGNDHLIAGVLAPFKGKPPLVGDGLQVYMEIRIESAFVVSAGSPIAQFMVVQSLAADLSAADTVVVGVASGPLQVGSGFRFGFAGLTGATVGLTCNVPISEAQPIYNLAASANMDKFRYLGIGIYVPNFADPATYSSGSISGRLVAAPQRDAASRAYPAAFNIK